MPEINLYSSHLFEYLASIGCEELRLVDEIKVRASNCHQSTATVNREQNIYLHNSTKLLEDIISSQYVTEFFKISDHLL